MGSFNLKCSVTRLTIAPGNEIHLQFMVPSTKGEMAFLHSKKYKSSYEQEDDFPNKEIKFSDTMGQWVPYGPAIPTVYDDYGRVNLLDSQECKQAVEILEILSGGISFKTLEHFSGNKNTVPLEFNIFTKNGTPGEEWQKILCKNITYTCIHTPVYKEMIKPNFVVEGFSGVKERKQKVELVKKQTEELITILKTDGHLIFDIFNEIKDVENNDYLFGLLYVFTAIKKHFIKKDEPEPADLAALKWKMMEKVRDIKALHEMFKDVLPMYLKGLVSAKSSYPLEWFFETHYLIHSMYAMDLNFQICEYGNQDVNWNSWKRLLKTVSHLR